MCISNIGNRRPFPTNGFKSRGAVDTTVSSDSSTLPAATSLKDTLKVDVNEDGTIHPHIIVQHDYHDHANDSRVDYQEDAPARGGVTTPFPLKLHDMLDAVIADGHDHIVSWQPHGRCFVVHKPKEFVELLPHYFKLSKLASFQRQLNLYGFQRLTRGRDRGGYYHELFLKGRVFLAHSIQRIKVKGTGVRARSNPDEEPDFWSMPWVSQEGKSAVTDSTSTSTSSSSSPRPSSPQQHKMMPQEEVSSSGTVMFNNTGLPASFFEQSFPLNLEPNMLFFPQQQQQLQQLQQQQVVEEDDIFLDGFGSKHFHFVQDQPSQATNPALLASEVDAFFEDFDFPDDIGNEIEDDEVFGDLLEQMCS